MNNSESLYAQQLEMHGPVGIRDYSNVPLVHNFLAAESHCLDIYNDLCCKVFS